MANADVIHAVNEYKRRLKPNNEYKTVFKALQKLNKIEMTVEILKETSIGKAVNALRKQEGYGDFAREIVTKWKKLISNMVEPQSSPQKPSSPPKPRYSTKVKYERPDSDDEKLDIKYEKHDSDIKQLNDNDQYDPSGNWEVGKEEVTMQIKQEIKYEQPEEFEYDPSRNWKMEKSSTSSIEEYVPSKNPENSARRKKDKKKSIKYEENNKKKLHKKKINIKMSPEEKRKAELKLIMEKAQRELASMEYKAPESTQASGGEEEREEANNSEDEVELDAPGAFFLTNGRRFSQSSNAPSEYSPTTPGVVPDSFLVSATTLYSRNKSVDSEEGNWENKLSYVPNIKSEKPDENEYNENIYENPNSINNEVNDNDSYDPLKPELEPSPKKVKKKDTKLKLKIKQENELNHKEIKHKKEKKKSEKKIENESKEKSTIKNIKKEKVKIENTSKRKSAVTSDGEPIKKKSKDEKKKKKNKESKSTVNNGPSFEDFMAMDTTKKVRKKKKQNPQTKPLASSSIPPKVELHLPEIQTNYRPLPPMPEPKHKEVVEHMTDDMAAELHSQRKYSRRGLFSGQNKFIPKMIPLFDMCIQVLLQNIDALDVIGVPYDIIEPVLRKCKPEQLYHLEDANPYFLESSDDLWKVHAKREFPMKKPDEMESWRELYLRLHDEREEKLARLTKKISAKEAQRKPLEKKLKLAYVGQTAKAPRGVRRAQEKYGTNAFTSHHDEKVTPRQELVEMRSRVLKNSTVIRNDRLSHRSNSPKKVKSAPLMSKTLKELKRMKFKR